MTEVNLPVAATTPGHKRVVAAFDFDGTISTCDSLREFVRGIIGPRRFIWAAIRILPLFLAVPFGGNGRGLAKRHFIKAALGGMSSAAIIEAATLFQPELARLIRPEMVERVQAHLARGHQVLLVSASPSVYLRMWAASVGIDTVLSTELDLGSAQFTGDWLTPNCWGPEKVNRLAAWWSADGNAPPDVLYAYGDSRGDREMAAAATYAWIRGIDTALPPLID